ncbi:MAG: hypothetical protein WKF58_13715 [Ilumatobacteraceae bacterium]
MAEGGATTTGSSDPFSDMVGLVAGPIAAGIRSIEQLRRGVDEFLRGVENFNATMENLNETAARINRLLGEIEEPVRAAMPQISRTVRHCGRSSANEWPTSPSTSPTSCAR